MPTPLEELQSVGAGSVVYTLPQPAATPAAGAAKTPEQELAELGVKPLSVEQLAADPKFDPVEHAKASLGDPAALTLAAQVDEHREKHLQPLAKRIGGFAKGAWDELANTGADAWHGVTHPFSYGDKENYEAKSGFGEMVQGAAKGVYNIYQQHHDLPGGDNLIPLKDWFPVIERKIKDGTASNIERDEYRQITERMNANRSEEIPNEMMPQSEDFWLSRIKQKIDDKKATPDEEAAYWRVLGARDENNAAVQLGAAKGLQMATKAGRWLKSWFTNPETLDDRKKRIESDAAVRHTADQIREGRGLTAEELPPGLGGVGVAATDKESEQLKAQGDYSPQDAERISGLADPGTIALMEAMPLAAKPAGYGLKLSGKAVRYLGEGAESLISKGAGKAIATGTAGAGAYYVGSHALHGDFTPLGAALGLLVAGGAMKLGGRVAENAGREMVEEGFVSGTARKAAEDLTKKAAAGEGATSATGAALENFVSGSQNLAAADRVARRTLQGAATGAAGAVPFAMGADNAEQAGKAFAGGAAFGAALGPLGGVEGSLNRAKEINQAATKILAERAGAQTFADAQTAKDHAGAMKGVSGQYQTYLDALRGLVSSFKNRNGKNLQIAVMPTGKAFADALQRAKPGAQFDRAAAERAHGFYDEASGIIYINKGNFRGDSAGHEVGHYLVDQAVKQMGGAYGDALKGAVEKGLFANGQPTPAFRRFIDSYNRVTPGKKIPTNGKPEDILAHDGVREYLSETTRNLLGEPAIGRFLLPKDVSDHMADSLVKWFGDAVGKKSDLFERTDLPTIHKAVSDIAFDLGKGMTPDNPFTKQRADEARTKAQADADAATAPPDAAQPAQESSPYADVGITQETLDAVRDYHISPPGMEPRTQRANSKRGIEGKSADRIAEERGQEWDEMLREYADWLRINGQQAPSDPTALHQAVIQHALTGSAAPRPGATAEPAPAPTAATPAAPAHPPISSATVAGLAPIQPQPAATAGGAPIAGAQPQPALAEAPGSSIKSNTDTAPTGRGALEDLKPGEPQAPAPTERKPALAEPDPERASEDDVRQAVAVAETDARVAEGGRKPSKAGEERVKKARVNTLLDLATEDAGADPSLLQKRDDGKGVRHTGRIDPEIPSHRAILDEAGVPRDKDQIVKAISDATGKTVYVDYQSAVNQEPGDTTAVQRRKEYRDSPAADRKAGGDHTLQTNKALHVLGFQVTSGGNVVVMGVSPDRVVSNAKKILDHLQGQKIDAGYHGINDPALIPDIQGYIRNHANGWKGDGSGPVEGAAPTPGYEPHKITRRRMDLINAAMHYDVSTKGDSRNAATRQKAQDAQFRALENGWEVSDATGDTNPLRDFLNQSGTFESNGKKGTGEILESVFEHISPTLIEDVRPTPGAQDIVRPAEFTGDPGALFREGVPNRDYTEAGFMPDSGKGALENFDKNEGGSFMPYAGERAKGFKDAEGEGRVFQGRYDDKPRFEIDDSTASLKKSFTDLLQEGKSAGEYYGETRLGDLLDHPALYENYPGLENAVVTVGRKMKGSAGVYLGQGFEGEHLIDLGPKATLSTLMHEVQHAIQAEEGFARGSTSQKGGRDAYLNHAGEIEARDVASRLNLSADERAKTPPYSSEDVPKDRAILDFKSAGNSGDFMPASGGKGALADYGKQDKLGFTSGLARIVADKIPNRAKPEQILATLKGAGAKAEEMEWMGLPEFLEGKQTVTKQELLDFIKSNQAELKEVVKGGEQERPIDDELIDKEIESGDGRVEDTDDGYSWTWRDQSDGETYRDWDSANDALIEHVRNHLSDNQYNFRSTENNETKFSQYRLPGGDNYKEVLLTLPKNIAKQKEAEKRRMAASESGDLEAFQSASREYNELEGGFKSSHWDEPNVLAHIRQADFKDADGSKVRLIEEIQSDWHQKGRKEGYASTEDTSGWSAELLNPGSGFNHWKITDSTGNEVAKIVGGNKEDAIRKASEKDGVPDAPFKKTWHELAFKRALRQAVEDGADKIAWVTGDIAAERFDLSKQLNGIQATKTNDGEYNVSAWGKADETVFNKRGLSESELEETVGKEFANKIIQQETNRTVNYEGLDLKVGGEGMKGFYDKIIPDFVRKYVKKWGGKVETTRVRTRGAHNKDFAPEVTGNFVVLNREGAMIQHGFTTQSEAQEWIRSHSDAYDNDRVAPAGEVFGGQTEAVHSVTITPEMRKAVMEGQSMFMPDSGAAKGERGALEDLGGSSIKSKGADDKGGALSDFMPYAGPRAKGFYKADAEGRTFEGPYDGRKRFEIPDKEMRLTPDFNELANNAKHAGEFHADNLDYTLNDDGTYDLSLRKKGAKTTEDFVKFSNASPSDIREMLGDDVLRRIQQGEGNENPYSQLQEGWRDSRDFEIDHKIQVPNAMKLRDLVDHPELFREYPGLRDVMVIAKPMPFGKAGGFYKTPEGEGRIIVSSQLPKPEVKKTLIHEIQHWIQDHENFAKGSGVEIEKNLHTDAAQQDAIDFMKNAREWDAIREMPEYKAAEAQFAKDGDLEKRNADPTIAEAMQLSKEMTEIAKKHGYSPVAFRRSIEKALDSGDYSLKDTAFGALSDVEARDRYRRSAGEAEARDAESRIGLSREERAQRAPYSDAGVDPRDAIVRFMPESGDPASIKSKVNPALDDLAEQHADKLDAHAFISTAGGNPIIKLENLQARKDAPKGSGSAYMRDLTDLADRHGLTIALQTASKGDRPSATYKTTSSEARLKKFYGQFGFKSNYARGSYRSDLPGNMHREPKGGDFMPESGLSGALSDFMPTDAYHGSPHKVSKFDLSKIGTGEGAAAYGHGLYFAENKDVAISYWPRDSRAEQKMQAEYDRASNRDDYDTLELWEAAMLHQLPDDIRHSETFEHIAESKREAVASKLEQILAAAKGGVYKVRMDVEPDEMLDWDKPLKEQPKKVRDALAEIDPDQYSEHGDDYDPNKPGATIYHRIAKSPKEASELLARHGVPALRYLDQQSRDYGNDEGTRNFVLFDDQRVRVTGRNGKVTHEHGGDRFMPKSEIAKGARAGTVGALSRLNIQDDKRKPLR